MGDLNAKQLQFCAEYLVDLNATQAAIRAGYAKKSAHVTASRLLSNAKIREKVADGATDRLKRTEIDADWLLQRLVEEAEADVADIHYDDGRLKPVSEWPDVWRKGLVQGIDVADATKSTPEITKIKVGDRLRRLELIGKHINIQAFKDKVEVQHVDRATILGRARERAGKE